MPGENTPESDGDDAENPALAASVALGDFLATGGGLTLAERFVLVDQALLLLHDNHVHLPLKQAMHAVDPVQRLRLLRARIEHVGDDIMGPEWRFHREMSIIFHSLRDLHTNYLLPEPFAGKGAGARAAAWPGRRGRPGRPPDPRPQPRNHGQAAEQASGKTLMPGFTWEISSCRNWPGNDLHKLAGGSRLRWDGPHRAA